MTKEEEALLDSRDTHEIGAVEHKDGLNPQHEILDSLHINDAHLAHFWVFLKFDEQHIQQWKHIFGVHSFDCIGHRLHLNATAYKLRSSSVPQWRSQAAPYQPSQYIVL